MNQVRINTHGGPRPNAGGRRLGAGRPRGSRNRLTTEMLEAAASMRDAKATLGGGQLPLEFLLATMRDESKPLEMRVRCAAEAAPYIHPKMPQAVVVGSEAKVEKVTVEVIGVPRSLLRHDIHAQSSENSIA